MLFKNFTLKQYALLVLYCLVLISLFLYSFTQIDLSLALSRNEGLQAIVKSFQYVGYFDRPLSSTLFISITSLLFLFYIYFLWAASKGKIQKNFAWASIICTTVILVFSYSAFSHDIFNYIFDAKIITNYGDNPYLQKALDYPTDPMLSFMHWTHRVFPYGPIWLVLTVPLSFIGFQFFLPTFLLFKLLMAASFLTALYFIGKILKEVAPERETIGLIFFGLNPLVIVESLVSAHIDIVMMAFGLWAVYFLVKKQTTLSYLTLIFSIGIKFVTGLLLPIFLLKQWYNKKKKNFSWNFFFALCVIALIGGVIAQTVRGNFQPWYLIDALAFSALIGYRYFIIIPSVVISFFGLLNYFPYLSIGNWDKPVPQMISDMNFVSYSLSLFLVVLYFFWQQILFAQTVRKQKKKK